MMNKLELLKKLMDELRVDNLSLEKKDLILEKLKGMIK